MQSVHQALCDNVEDDDQELVANIMDSIGDDDDHSIEDAGTSGNSDSEEAAHALAAIGLDQLLLNF